ncbi:hypothetical protein [Natronogracilivirga saccharolytica]|uniref:Uncharacterized protein n=1 Tax=Natronogracilivirga saccharolytica TaxID=2812953 RepID=A0A8J7UTW7_9BACT|nr:hypothetical protein [Natronogracilivirga saccharolytica]MBP3192996.1 hypothetical protein [Natronogracilivirga saccharolytica]
MLPIIPAIPVIAYKISTGIAVGVSIITGIWAKGQYDERWYEKYKYEEKIENLEKVISEMELQYQELRNMFGERDQQVRDLASRIKELKREVAELKAEAETAY